MLSNHCAVHNDGAHTNQCAVLNFTAVQNHAVTNSHAFSNRGAVLFISAMDYTVVLNVAFIANSNRHHVAANADIVPNAAFVSDNDVANDRGIFCDKYILTNFRLKATRFSNYGFHTSSPRKVAGKLLVIFTCTILPI